MKFQTDFWVNPRTYRQAAFYVNLVGSLLFTLNWQAQNPVAFVGVLILFISAFIAITGVMLGIKKQDNTLVIQCVILMMWAILLPLILLSKHIA
ncbi:hypothetical protein [Stenoxybacter acetivorans]|uniref:hypothetical protein n=1 Tax=Stenoxybacter acetivorans TaxID=422441 RepID=UPI00055A75FE|nr:hypothetical protein [Stenoxybacter acetivorans]